VTPVHEPALVADEIEARLREAGTPERAHGQKAYLKSSLTHLGVTVWQIRREARAAAKDVSSHDELVALAEALWAPAEFDRRLCAAFLLEARVDLLEVARTLPEPRIVEEFAVRYRIRGSVAVDAESEGDARRAAFRTLRERFAGTRHERVAWEAG